jgi:hypothetical protein
MRKCYKYNLSFQAFIVMMIQVEVFWVVTPCSVVVGYQCFRGPCCLQGEVTRMEKIRHRYRPRLKRGSRCW